MRICLANLLLFISLYLLYPVLPVVMASRLGVPVSQTGEYIYFYACHVFIGPFHAYLVDVYKRKYICMLSFGIMVAATAGYTLVQSATHLLLLCLVQESPLEWLLRQALHWPLMSPIPLFAVPAM